MGKVEIARSEQFLLFPQCFLPIWMNFLPSSSNLKVLSANSFSLEESKFVTWERVNHIFHTEHIFLYLALEDGGSWANRMKVFRCLTDICNLSKTVQAWYDSARIRLSSLALSCRVYHPCISVMVCKWDSPDHVPLLCSAAGGEH